MIRKYVKVLFVMLYQRFFGQLLFSIGENSLAIKRGNYPLVRDLWEVDQKIYSQWGEDGIIDYVMWSLALYKPRFVEIGTEDYRQSNTRFLFERTGPQGLIIDCDPNLKSIVSRIVDLWKGELSIVSSFVTKENINATLEENGFLSNVDLFSIDIDGVDYWVLNETPFENFKCIVVEYNAYFGHEHAITIPYTADFNKTKYHFSNLCFGASLRAFIELLAPRGFTFIGTNLRCSNAFFVRNDFAGRLSIKPPPINDLSKYTQNFIRESRSEDGSLSYVDSKDRDSLISDCEVYDLSRKTVLKFRDLGR